MYQILSVVYNTGKIWYPPPLFSYYQFAHTHQFIKMGGGGPFELHQQHIIKYILTGKLFQMYQILSVVYNTGKIWYPPPLISYYQIAHQFIKFWVAGQLARSINSDNLVTCFQKASILYSKIDTSKMVHFCSPCSTCTEKSIQYIQGSRSLA